MRKLQFRMIVLALSTAVTLLGASCKESPKPTEVAQNAAPEPAPSVPAVKVTPPVQAKAMAPKPTPDAVKKPSAQTFGKGRASVTFQGQPATRSFWSEQLDVDNSGKPVLVDEAWDNHSKILYINDTRGFTCANGQTGTGSVLTAVYGKGNTRKRPAGSGWWVAELNAGDCHRHDDTLYGCRFDAAGNNSDCGVATVQPEDIVIVPESGSGASSGDASSQPASPSAPAAAPSTGTSGQSSPPSN